MSVCARVCVCVCVCARVCACACVFILCQHSMHLTQSPTNELPPTADTVSSTAIHDQVKLRQCMTLQHLSYTLTADAVSRTGIPHSKPQCD